MKKKKITINLIVIFLLIVLVLFGRNWVAENLFFGYITKESRNLKKSLFFEKVRRTYLIHFPPENDNADSTPLVFILHGAGGNAEITAGMSGMNEVADKNGFIAVYPNGTGVFSEFFLSWNAGDCCNYLNPAEVNDVGFINFLIDKLEHEYNIDKKRIYVAGFSNGGMMAYKLACEITDRIAAFAPVSASMFLSECSPKKPISVIVFHNATDEVIPYFGGESSDPFIKFFHLKHKSVLESVDFWAEHNNCLNQSEKVTDSVVYQGLFTDCDNGSEVLFYVGGEGGHSWPGGEKGWLFGSKPVEALRASEIIWDFFESHPKK